MQVWPVILDAAPIYLGRPGHRLSVLSTPLGRSALLSSLLDHIGRISVDTPTILAPEGSDASYVADLRAACPGAIVATSAAELTDILAHAEPSDLLLFVDPQCLPVDTTQLAEMVEAGAAHPQMARHLVGYTADMAGTRENVNVDAIGQVRSVHRYYKPATWPFIAVVAASVVPVSSGLLPLSRLPATLLDLRQTLVSRGVTSGDIVMTSGAFDLTSEQGLLAAVEHSVERDVDADPESGHGTVTLVGRGHQIDPTARLLGPVIVQDGVRIGARATVVGPSLLGAGSRIDADAIVAHVALGAGAVVTERQVLRDRAWFVADAAAALDAAATAVTAPSFAQRLARQGFDTTGPTPERPSLDQPVRVYPALKRACDVTIAATALILLSPVLAVIAALVWLDSRGPVIFPHPREGVDGRLFNCLKFRTMRVGANDLQRKLKKESALDGPHFKLDADPRITTIGRILRATNVDELPQLVNVLRGDMSLVGPRPSPFRENQVCVPWRNGRLSVRPGITGLWQVCRHDRADGDFHQWIEYDLLYVQRLAPLLDAKILAATFFTLGGKFPVPVTWLVNLSSHDSGPATARPARTAAGALARAERPAPARSTQ